MDFQKRSRHTNFAICDNSIERHGDKDIPDNSLQNLVRLKSQNEDNI